MNDQSKTRVIGAFLVGFAIVAGAYTVSNFGESSMPAPSNTAATAIVAAPLRVALPVADTNGDGIEDWQETFVSAGSQINLDGDVSSDYVVPDTLTDQVGVAFLQEIVRAKGYGAFGKSEEEVIKQTVDQISTHATDRILDLRDITISQDISNEAVRAYGNAMADAILQNGNPNLRHELLILEDVMNNLNPESAKELAALSNVYQNTLTSSLAIPVPSLFVKEHLDLINVYNALYNDILTMSKALSDPMLSLVRLKRYEEDATGLALALQNLYLAVEPYAAYFEREDSAVFFVNFSPDYQ
jgi:hypothetical protein